MRVIGENARNALESIDGVEKVSFYNKRDYTENILAGKNKYIGSIYGIDAAFMEVQNYRTIYGRTFTDADFDNFRKVVILDKKSAGALFPGRYPVGQSVEINGDVFSVVGVVEKVDTFKPTITTLDEYHMYADTSSGALFIPGTTWPVIYLFDEPQNVAVRVESTDQMTKAGKAVADLLTGSQIRKSGLEDARNSIADEAVPENAVESNEVFVGEMAGNGYFGDMGNGEFSYRSQDLLEQAEQLQKMSNSTNQQLIWIASISLLVGGIGVMNIMLVSVTERTGEIGLKKALGAKKRRIRLQFLTEAAVLTSFGGILGIILGTILAEIISRTNGIPVAISVPAIVISVAFSMAIGVVFGLLPAMKAANLNPIEALQRD